MGRTQCPDPSSPEGSSPGWYFNDDHLILVKKAFFFRSLSCSWFAWKYKADSDISVLE